MFNLFGRPTLKRIIWQAWSTDDDVTFAPADRVDYLRAERTIADNAVLLHEIIASTGEDAMAQHHEKMGWEPYRPQGDSVPCPNDCGENYYPEGYGDCPRCGHIG